MDSAKYTLAGVAGVNITGAHPAWVLEIPVAASVAGFTVTVADDADTVNESLGLTLGSDTMVPPRWRLAPGAGVHTVAFVDDDATQPSVGFAAGSPAVATEGTAGVLLGVVVENPGSSVLSVSIGAAGTAVAEDYSLRLARVPAPPAGALLSGAHDTDYTLTVPVGATALYLRVQAAEDADQMDETLVLTLGAGAGYALLAATRTLTLLGADVVPVVGFAQSASTVTEDAGEVVKLVLSVTGSVQGELSVAWRARLVTGQVDTHEYQVGNLALPARAGAVLGGVAQVRATGGEVPIRIRNDRLQELADGEVLELVLQPGEGYTLGAGMTGHRLTIQEGVCDRTLAVSAGLTGLAAEPGCAALDSAALAGLDGTLDLSATGLDTLTAMDFVDLSMLRGLNLSDNALRVLPAGLFEPLDSLVQLDLSGNAGLSVAAGMLDGLLSRAGVSLALPEPSRLSIVGGGGSPTAGGSVQFDMVLDRPLPFELELSYTYSGEVQPLSASGRVVFASADRMQSVTVQLPPTALAGEALTLEPTLMVRTTEGAVSPSSANIVGTTIVRALTEATVRVVPGIPMVEAAFVRPSDVVSRNADVVRVPVVIRNLPANSGVELRVEVVSSRRNLLETPYQVKIGSAASMLLPAFNSDALVGAKLRIDNNTDVAMDKVVDVAEIEVRGGGGGQDRLGVRVRPSVEAPPAGMTTVPVSVSPLFTYQLVVRPGKIPSLSFDVAELEVEEDDGDAGTAVRTVMVPLRVSDLAPTIRRVTVTFDPVLVTAGAAESDEYQALGVAVPHDNAVVMHLDTDGSSPSRVFMLPVQIRDDTLAEDPGGETLELGIDSSSEVRFEFVSGNAFSIRPSIAPVTLRVLEGICDSRTAAVAAALAVAARVGDCYRVSNLGAVRNLDLRGLGLGELVVADLAGLQQLQQLQLDQNALSTLTASVFADLDALTSLTLTRNPSLSLPVGVLDGVLDTLETLAVDAPLRPQVEVRADGGRFVLELTRGLPVELRVPYTLSGTGFSSVMAMATVPAGSTRVGIALPGSASGLANVQLGGLDDWQVWDSGSTALGVLGAGSLIQVPVGSAASLTVPEGTLPVLTFSSAMSTTVTEGGSVMLTATLTPAPTSADGLTVPMTIVETLGSNYTLTATGATLSTAPRMLTFPMGVSTATLALMAEEDDDIAGAFVQLNLEVDTSSPGRWQLGDRPHVRVLIADNDVLPEIRFAQVRSEVEGDPGTAEVELEAYGLASAATVEVLLTMRLESGSALADEYTLGGGGATVTLPAGFASTIDFMVTLTGDGSDPYRSNVTVGVAEVIGQEIEDADGEVLRLSLRTDAAYTLQSEPSMAAVGYTLCEHARTCHAVRVLEGVCDRTAGVSAGLAAQTGQHCTAVDTATLRDMGGTLDLSGQGITALQVGDFAGLGSLPALDLSDNTLSTLVDDVFDSLDALVVLDLSGNAFTGVPEAALAGVSGLETLDLSGNGLIGALSGQPFAAHGMLRRLLLQDNQLTMVAADALTLTGGARMAMLEVLDLSSNALTGLAADSLTGMDSLRELDLSGNSGFVSTAGMLDEVLDTLQYFVMEDLPAYLSAAVGASWLPEVRLSAPLPVGLRVAYTLQTGTGAAQPETVEFAVGETLQTIMPLAGTEPTILRLRPESEWQLLDADSQVLSAGTLGVRHFVNLRTVEELRYTPSADPTAVVSICRRIFAVREALREALRSSGTACEEVTAGQLANVETLDLSKRNLGIGARVRGRDLAGLTGLRRLDLSDNFLNDGDIVAELFEGLPALEELDLSNNFHVGSLSLPELPRLEVLNLGGMSGLSSIPDGTFRALPALRTLVLHSSGLRTLPADIGSLASLQTLDLRNMRELSLTTELLDRLLDAVPAPSGDTGLLVDQVVVELHFGVEFRAQPVTALTDVTNDYFHIVLAQPLPLGLRVAYSLTQEGVTSSHTVDVAAGATVQTVPLPGTAAAGSTLVVRLGELSTWSLLGATAPALPLSVLPADALVDVGQSSLSLTVPDDITTRYPLVRLNFVPEFFSSSQLSAPVMGPLPRLYRKGPAATGEVSIEVQVLGLGAATTLTVPWQLAVQELDDVAETGEYSVDGMAASTGTFMITGDGSPVVTRTVRLGVMDDGTSTGRETVSFSVGESTDNPAAYQLSTTSSRFILYVRDVHDVATGTAFTATVQAVVSVGEDAGSAMVPVTVIVSGSAASQGAVTVMYSITDGTASGTDYTVPSPASLVFTVAELSGGTATKNISIPIMDDTTDESDETFTVTLEVPTGAAADSFMLGSPSSSTVTIMANDGPPNTTPQPIGTLPSVSVVSSGTQIVDVSNAFQDTDTGDMLSYSARLSATGVVSVAVTGSMVTLTALSVGTSTVTVTATDRAGAMAVQIFTVTVTAPLPPGVTVSRANLSVPEGGMGTYTVVLDAAPTADVVITPASDNGDVTFSPSTLTFATDTWSSAQGVTVSAADDDDTVNDQAALSHTAASTDSNYAGISIASVAVTVMDDRVFTATVQAAISVGEDAGPAMVPVTVSGSAAPQGDITVTYSITPGTASGTDYTVPNPASLVFAVVEFSGGTATKNISIPIMDDMTDEPDETFTVTLEIPTGDAAENFAVGGPSSSTVTITDNEMRPDTFTLSLSPISLSESAGATTVTVGVTLSGTTSLSTQTEFGLSATGSATAPDDYTQTGNLVVTVPPESLTGSTELTLTPMDDMAVEGDETLQYTVTSNGFASQSVTLTLTDNDTATATDITLSLDRTSGTEGDSPTDYTVTAMSGATATTDIVVTLMLGGTATATGPSADYMVSGTQSITISTGASTGMTVLTLTLVDDRAVEGTESIVVAGMASSFTIAGSPVITLQDNDAAPSTITLTTDPAEVMEGAGATGVVVTATLGDGGVTLPDAVNIALELGGSASPDDDYTVTGTLLVRIPAGSATGMSTLTITAQADAVLEMESIEITGARVAGYTVTGATLALQDATVYTATVPATVSVTEGTAAVVPVTVTGDVAPRGDVTVPYSLVLVTARAGFDYTVPSTGALLFTTIALASGSASQDVSIPILDDGEAESAETFQVMLDTPVGAAGDAFRLGDVSSTAVTIMDADSSGNDYNIAFSPATATVEEGSGMLRLMVTVSPSGHAQNPQAAVAVPLQAGGGTAQLGTDYTAPDTASVQFAVADFTNGMATQEIVIGILEDVEVEGEEAFTVGLGNVVGAVDRFAVTQPTTVVTIEDNDSLFSSPSFGETVSVQAFGSGSHSREITGPRYVAPGELVEYELITTEYRRTNRYTISIFSGTGPLRDWVDRAAGTCASGAVACLVVPSLPGGFNPGSPSRQFYTTQGGMIVRTIRVRIPADAGDELTFLIGLNSTPTTTSSTATITVQAPRVSIVERAMFAESAGTLRLAVSVSSNAQDIDVPFTVVADSATATEGTDFHLQSVSPLRFVKGNFRSGVATKDIEIALVDDRIPEAAETFTIMLGTPISTTISGFVVEQDSAQVTINDDDDVGVITAGFEPITSLVDEQATGMVAVALDSPPGSTLSIPLTATAAVDSAKYTLAGVAGVNITGSHPAWVLEIPVAASVAEFTVTVADDADTVNESLGLTLGSDTMVPPRWRLAPGAGVHTVAFVDDDATQPSVGFAAGSPAVATEGAAGVLLGVVVENPGSSALSVSVGAAGTAVAEDYSLRLARVPAPPAGALLSGAHDTGYTLTVPAGATALYLRVQAAEDADQMDETLVLTLGADAGYALLAATRTLTLLDADVVPVVGFAQSASTVTEDAGEVVKLVLSVTGPVQGELSVAWRARLVTGQVDTHEYQVGNLALPARAGAVLGGVAQVRATGGEVPIRIRNDRLQELADGEVLELVLQPGEGYTLGAGMTEHRLTIQEGVCDRTLAVSAGLTGLAAEPGCAALDSAALARLDGTLDLSATGLDTLTAMDFVDLSMLRGLNLSDNALRVLPAGLFEPLDSLVQLDLSGNAGLSVAAGMLDGLLSRAGVSLALPEPSRLSIVGGGGSPTAGGLAQFDMVLDRPLPFELELSYTHSGEVQPLSVPGRVVFASADRMQSVTVQLPPTALVGEALTLEVTTLMVRTTEGAVSPSSANIVATTIVRASTEATIRVVPGIPMAGAAFVRQSDVVSRNADVVRVPVVIRNLPANSGVELRVQVVPYFRNPLKSSYRIRIGSVADATLPAFSNDASVAANLRIDNNTAAAINKVVDAVEIEVEGGIFSLGLEEGLDDDLLAVLITPSAEDPPAEMTTVPVSVTHSSLYQLTVRPGKIPSLSFDVAELEVEEDDGDAGTAVRTVMVPLRVSDLAPTIRRVTVTFDSVLVTAGAAESDEYQALGVAVPHDNAVVMHLDTDGSSSSRVFMLPVQIRDDTLAEDLVGETLALGIDRSSEVRFEFVSGNSFPVSPSIGIDTVTLRVLEGVCDSRTAAVAAALAVAAGVRDCYRVSNLDTVRNLDLRGLGLGELVAADLAGLQQLQQLQLDQNALSTLTASVFADLDALTSLTLTRNPSLSLPVGVLDGVLDTLETLAVDAPLRPQVEVRADGGRLVLELTRGLPVELRVPYTLSGTGFSSVMAMATVPAGSTRVGIALPGSASGLANVQLGGLDDWQVWDSGSTARRVLGAGSLIQVPVGSAASLTVPGGTLPVLTFSSAMSTTVTEGGSVMLTATLTPAPTSADGLTVPMTIVETLGSNYTLTATGATLSTAPRMLTFPMGVSTATLALMAEEDDDIAGAFVQLNLEVDTSSPGRWQLGDRPHVRVLIADNDVLPEIRFAQVRSEVEGDPGTAEVELEAYGLESVATVEVLLTMRLESGSALADEYTLGGGGATVTLPAGLASTIDFMVTLTGDGSDPYRSNVTVGVAEVIGQEIEDADGEVLRLSLRTDAAYTLQSEPSMAAVGYTLCEHARTCHAVRVLEGVCDRTAGVSAGLAAQTGQHCTAVDTATLRDMGGTLDLSGQGITALQVGDFAGLGSLPALDLSGNTLSTLADDVFDSLDALVVLDLSGNAFTGVPEAALAGVSGLETLDLSGNGLSGALSGQPFAAHGMLRRLLLQDNQLTMVAADALTLTGGARMAMLEVLDLSSNALTGLAADSLTGMDSLRELDLSGNSEFVPTTGMLDEVLDTLQYFVMEDLPADLSAAAVGASWLPEVRLSAPLPMGLRVAYTLQTGTGAAQPETVEFAVGETLQTIMPLAGTEPTILRLRPESEWQLLDADSQVLSAGTLGVRHFVNLRTVEELRYTPSANPAATVDICERILAVRKALREALRISSTTCDVRAGQLANVETLDLSKRNLGLTSPRGRDLAGLTGLRRLDLSDNFLNDGNIVAELFEGLPALEELDLSNNFYVGNLSLPELPRLEVLNLGGMSRLSSIPDGTFRALPALRTLVLHGSGLRTLPADIGSLASLQTLDLRNMRELSLTTELLDRLLDAVPAPSGDTGLLVDQVVVELHFGVEFRVQPVTALTDVTNDYFHIVLAQPLPLGLRVAYSLTQEGVTSSHTVDVVAGATVQTVPLPGTAAAGSTLVVRLGELSTWSLLGATAPALPLSVLPADALVDVGLSSLSLTVPDDITTRYPLVRLNFVPEFFSSSPTSDTVMGPLPRVYQKGPAAAGEVSMEVQVLGLDAATTLTVPWQLAVQELDDVVETGEYSVDGVAASTGTFMITGDGSPVVTRTVRLGVMDDGTSTGRETVSFSVGESTDNPAAYQLSTTSSRFVLYVRDVNEEE